jgi:hypothetical protein
LNKRELSTTQQNCKAVLPTPAKLFLPDFLKNSAAGEKIRPHTHCSIEAGLIDVSKDSEGMVMGKSQVFCKSAEN